MKPNVYRQSRIRCLVSTGLGRLHLIQTAHCLHEAGLRVEVVQGWVPRVLPKRFIDFLGELVNSKHLAVGMSKRQLPFLGKDSVHSCAFSEFFTQGLFLLNRFGLLTRGKAARLGWFIFGWSSSRSITRQDIFHVRSGAGRGGAIKKAKNRGIKVVVDHSIAHPKFLEDALRSEYQRFNMPFWLTSKDPFWKSVISDCSDSDLVLVNSDFVKETMIRQGFSKDRIKVVYLGVREKFFDLKRDYTVDSTLNLLFTGGFGLRKGAQYLLPALKQIADLGMEFKLTVVGAFDEAKVLIDSSKLDNRISCVGFVPQDDLVKYLTDADIYVFPSLAEGCASSGMEAMAAGLPVIATRESGLPIQHGVNGWLIPSKSDQAIADAIRQVSADKELRRNIGRQAAKTISENCTWSQYAESLRDIYLSLVTNDTEIEKGRT